MRKSKDEIGESAHVDNDYIWSRMLDLKKYDESRLEAAEM